MIDIDLRVPQTQCIKIKALRERYGLKAHLEKWMQMDDTLYVCRGMRIFIHENGEKRAYFAKQSKWHNPFKVGKNADSVEDCAQKYEQHVRDNLWNDLPELAGKTLGCFCDQSGTCHAKQLKKLFVEYHKLN